MRDVVKTIDHPNGKPRLEFVRNPSDGTFTFEEFVLDEQENVFCPLRAKNRSLSRTESIEAAFKEARSRIEWLKEMQSESK